MGGREAHMWQGCPQVASVLSVHPPPHPPRPPEKHRGPEEEVQVQLVQGLVLEEQKQDP